MHVQKAEERKWCPGNPCFQMLPSAFKSYIKQDLKRKRKRKYSLFLKHRTGFRRSRRRLQLCGRLSTLPLVGYWNRELENCQTVLSSGRLSVLKPEYRCTDHSKNAVSGLNERVCTLTHALYSKILWLGIC